ncbi:MAG: hypothetical protein V9G20_24625 [Candidatus Promineifilaceae bacterium]
MEPHEISHRDRVYIDEGVMDIYRSLTDGSNKEQSPFSTYKDVFLFAACIGFHNGRRKKLPVGAKNTIRLDVFRDEGIGLIKALAIATTGDVIILTKPSDFLEIAEEYANSGIHDVKSDLLDERGHPLWNLVNLLGEHEA